RTDPLRNLHGELERGGRLKSGDARLATGACAFDERDKLLLQRFLAFDRNLVACNLSRLAPINLAALFFVIEREIGVLLKNADLAHPFGTDATRSDIRDAAVFERNPRVRDVFAAAQRRHADGLERLHRRSPELQNGL